MSFDVKKARELGGRIWPDMSIDVIESLDMLLAGADEVDRLRSSNRINEALQSELRNALKIADKDYDCSNLRDEVARLRKEYTKLLQKHEAMDKA